MAVKKSTTKKATKVAPKETKVAKPARASKEKTISKVLEEHIYVILAIVVTAFIIFSIGMAAGAAIIVR